MEVRRVVGCMMILLRVEVGGGWKGCGMYDNTNEGGGRAGVSTVQHHSRWDTARTDTTLSSGYFIPAAGILSRYPG